MNVYHECLTNCCKIGNLSLFNGHSSTHTGSSVIHSRQRVKCSTAALRRAASFAIDILIIFYLEAFSLFSTSKGNFEVFSDISTQQGNDQVKG